MLTRFLGMGVIVAVMLLSGRITEDTSGTFSADGMVGIGGCPTGHVGTEGPMK